MRQPRPRSDGLRLTKVGVWFAVFLVIVLLAAVNTGNNGLFLVLAVMGAALVVAQLLARWNVGGLTVALEPPAEVFAGTPCRCDLTVANRGRRLAWWRLAWWRLPRWWLVATLEPDALTPTAGATASPRRLRRVQPLFIPALGRRQTARGQLDLLFGRRGRHRLTRLHVWSLFPLGFFRKGVTYPIDVELLVYPELFAPALVRTRRAGRAGAEPARRAGWGPDLFGLRAFRHGDDPRGIHWKQSARTGRLIFTERETEESRRLMIVFDNAVGPLASDAEQQRFERLVSEAATAAVDYLAGGYEVALVTRDTELAYGGGARQRQLILETLALVEPAAARTSALQPPDRTAPYLALAMEPTEDAA